MNGHYLTYLPLKGDQEQRYVLLLEAAHELADKITEFTPESREQEIALTKLDEVLMWTNIAIARNE